MTIFLRQPWGHFQLTPCINLAGRFFTPLLPPVSLIASNKKILDKISFCESIGKPR